MMVISKLSNNTWANTGPQMWKFQVWKLPQRYSVDISWFFYHWDLREIKFGDFRVAKPAILTHSEALNSDFHECLHFLNAEIYQTNKI